MIRIAIDRDRCVGSGNCLFWAPGTFDLGDDGLALVIDPGGDDEDRIRVAAEGCPTRAISVEVIGGPDGN
jgi:ferredoxin